LKASTIPLLASFYNTSFGNGMPIIVGILAMFCNAVLSCTERQEMLRVMVGLSSVGLSLLLAVMQFVAINEINDGNQGIICSDQDDDDVSLMCDAMPLPIESSILWAAFAGAMLEY
jgi:hypothetical protein